MLDIIIRNGTIIDGSGASRFQGDLGLKHGYVEQLGDLSDFDSSIDLDASGLIVAPGFIDVHTHSDISILINPKSESAVRQGVTTHVFPNCGTGIAPASGEALKDIEQRLSQYDLQVNWTSVSDYFKYVMKQQPSINVVPMIAHGTVRMAVMGYDNRIPTSNELDQMNEHVEEAMKNGAFGLCSGLRYTPSGFAKPNELIELCLTVKKYGGLYTTHMRSEGDNGDWFNAINEAIEVGEKSGIPVQPSHLKALGKSVWGKSPQALSLIEDAKNRGVDISCDQYPYEASSSTLLLLFPQWANDGGVNELLNRLDDSSTYDSIKDEFNQILDVRGGPMKMTISKFEQDPSLQGKSLAEVSTLKKMNLFDSAIFLIKESLGKITMIYHVLDADDVRRIMKHPMVMIASDGSVMSPYGLLSTESTHPRSYGCFPRVLSKFVRDEKLLSLEEAIYKMTLFPSRRFKINDRGLLKKGMAGDVVIFDDKTIQDLATFTDPHKYPEGISYVIINGEIVIDHESHTDLRPGKLLANPGLN